MEFVSNNNILNKNQFKKMKICISFENDKSSSNFIDSTNKISEFYTWYFKKYFKLKTTTKVNLNLQ